MDYSCDRCGYETDAKKNMIQHLKRKFPCEPILCNTSPSVFLEALLKKENETGSCTCNYCERKFNTRQGKSRHQMICKQRPEFASGILGGLQKAVQELNEKIKNQGNILNSQNTISSHNTTNSNNTNNINVKIEMRDFGHENMAALPDSAIRDNIIFLKFIDILEMLHFDDEFPENRNFKLVSLKNEIMQFYKNQKWQAVSMQRGIDDIIMHVCRIYRNFYYRNKEDVEEDMGEDDALKLLEDLEEIYKLDKNHVKDIRKDIRALLYNYKDE